MSDQHNQPPQDPMASLAASVGLDPTRLGDGIYIGSKLKEQLGVGPDSTSSFPGVSDLLAATIDKAGKNYNSSNLVERAKAHRLFSLVLDRLRPTEGADSQSPSEKFLDTSLAPEEFTASLVDVAQNIAGETGRSVRQRYGIAEPQGETAQKPRYTGKEAMIASGLVVFGMDAAGQAEEADKLLRPGVVFNNKNADVAIGVLTQNAAFSDEVVTRQLFDQVQAKVVADMAGTFDQQDHARKAA